MGRKLKYSKETKINIVKRYLSGEGSTITLANEIGTDNAVIGKWVKRYLQLGESAFDKKETNASYTKEFKEQVVNAYLNSEGTLNDLVIQYHVPSVGTISKWIDDYQNNKELKDYIPANKEIYTKKSRKIIQTERIEIAKYCIEHDLNYKSTAEIYQTSYANVFNWVRKYQERGEEGLSCNKGRPRKVKMPVN